MDTGSNIKATYGIELDDLQDWEKFEMSMDGPFNTLVIKFIATPKCLAPVQMQRLVSLGELSSIKDELLPMALLSIVKDTRDKFRELVKNYIDNNEND
jgi:hypothetical protein